jgi:murein DD-endopeptidase MepM/ murein hydrolase activator NlpD
MPIDPTTATGLVVGAGAARHIVWGAGPPAELYSRDHQPAADAELANRAGWNCRTHQQYEGRPAVDWYIPAGTPVHATMDGAATLYVITSSNAFDVYGVPRAPYLGNPDRAAAPLNPFPGPGGGKGVFVRVENEQFSTEYAHLDLETTAPSLPAAAFLPGYTGDADLAGRFAAMRDFQSETPVARWAVRRGDLIGYSGDSGYSEAPHLHYTVSRAGGPLLCPTTEAGFADGGWLFH